MFWERISTGIAQLGVLDGLLYFAHRALGKISGDRARIFRYYLVAQPVAGGAHVRPSPRNPVSLIDATDPLRASFPRPPHVIEKRFRDGDLCFVARSSDKFAGFLWLARSAYEEDEVRCLYTLAHPDESAWDYDVYVEPEYRVGRTFARLWDAANRHLADHGVSWTFSRISGFNPGSLQVHGKLGVRRLFSATFVCIGGVQVVIAGAPPYLHASFRRSSRPVLSLSPPKNAFSRKNAYRE